MADLVAEAFTNELGQTIQPGDEVVYFEGSPSLRGSIGSLLLSAFFGLGLAAGSVFFRSYGWWLPLVGAALAILLVTLPGTPGLGVEPDLARLARYVVA